MDKRFKLSDRRRKEGEQWRLRKCGSLDFNELKKRFEMEVREHIKDGTLGKIKRIKNKDGDKKSV